MHVEMGKHSAGLLVRGRPEELRQVRCLYIDPYKHAFGQGLMPLTPHALHILKEMEPRAVVHPEVAAWYRDELRRRYHLSDVTRGGSIAKDERLHFFQQQGVSFLIGTSAWYGSPRAMLADDPRLGKTIQSLVTLELYGRGPALIVTMKALIDFWAEKVTEWTSFELIIVNGKTQDRAAQLADLHGKVAAVTNWDTLRLLNNPKLASSLKLKPKQFPALVCDEAHEVRNRKVQVTKAFSRLRPECVVLASATMIEHGPQDYFPLVHMLRPQEFNSYWRWVGWFCATRFNGFGQEIVGSQNEDVLRDLLTPLAIGRKAKEVAQVPEKVYERVPIQAPEALMAIYRDLEEKIMVEVGTEFLTLTNKLARMVRLRQLSSCPRIFGLDMDSPKIDAVADYIATLPERMQVVVYTSFRESAQQTAQQLWARGFTATLFIGGSAAPTEFLEGKTRVLVATPEVGGVGQDYACADVIIYLDLPLSATILRQSQERTTKMGTKEPRLIVSIACTPIDYSVAAALEAKQESITDVDIYDFILRSSQSRTASPPGR